MNHLRRLLYVLLTALVFFAACMPCAGAETMRNWQSILQFPSASAAQAHSSTARDIAPYIAAWIETGTSRYTEYAADFKADYLPRGTYCSLSNFYLDYSSLLKKYRKVSTEAQIGGYAGFQRTSEDRLVSILSFWDVFCEDADGRVTTIRARQVYPETVDADNSFSGEGTGAHTLRDYRWEANHWYRMLLQCGVSETSGNTVIQQWVQDLETGTWTYLCAYDLGVPDVAFQGDTAIFLENYHAAYSGEVRTMEVRNIRIRDMNTGRWRSLRKGSFSQNYDHAGSYMYGADRDSFYIITCGIQGLCRNPAAKTLSVQTGDAASPY